MATVAEQLADARIAYHDLITGKAVRVVIDQNGERVEFQAANRQLLYLYIMSLERQLTIPITAPSGPAGYIF